MPSRLNTLMLEELTEKFRGVRDCVFVDFTGLDGRKAADLRNQLEKTCGEEAAFLVVKGALARRALVEGGSVLEPDADLDAFFTGPTAVAYGPGDPVEVVRTIFDWGKKENLLRFKGGLLDGRPLAADAVGALALIPPKHILMAQVIGTIAAPLSGLLGVAQGTIRKLLGLADALVKKKSEAS
jgi:large subunit ribosomal protein L10